MATTQPTAAEITGHVGPITALAVGFDDPPKLWSGGADGRVLEWNLAGATARSASPETRDAVVALVAYRDLDKLFQLTVRVPVVSALDQSGYLAQLLAVGRPSPDVAEEVAEGHRQLSDGHTDAEVVAVLENASPGARAALRATAIEKLSDERVQAATEHALQEFAEHLEPNPRAMKRFVNEFGLARVVLTLEDALVPFDVLARWTILSTRWPMLADRLREHPEEIELVGTEALGVPDDVRVLLRSPGVEGVARELNRAQIELCVTGRATT